MIRTLCFVLVAVVVVQSAVTQPAKAQFPIPTLPEPIVPFVEDFKQGLANFGGGPDELPSDLGDGDLVIAPTGGVGNSSLLTTSHALSENQGVVFRAEAILGSSGSAFTGDWIAAGVNRLSAFVTHDAPVPLNISFRIATQTPSFFTDNFPGAFILNVADVVPNTLTPITADIDSTNIFDPANFQFGDIGFLEGSGDFNSLFSDVTNIQVIVGVGDGFEELTQELIDAGAAPAGASLGDVFAVDTSGVFVGDAVFNLADEFNFGLDNLALAGIPEPGTAMLLTTASLVALVPNRRRPG